MRRKWILDTSSLRHPGHVAMGIQKLDLAKIQEVKKWGGGEDRNRKGYNKDAGE